MQKVVAITAYVTIVGILAFFAGSSMYHNYQKAQLERIDDEKVGALTGPTWEEFVATIEVQQNNLLSQYSDYIQYHNGELYYKNQPINNNRFKNLIPTNTDIYVYTTPDGSKGFQAVQYTANSTSTHVRSFAIGPEALDRTYEIDYVLPTI